MVIVSFETLNMAEQFTIESLPVHLITQYAVQGLVEPVRAWMKKTGLTDQQIKRFADRYPPKDVNLSRYKDIVKKMTKRQREGIPVKALVKMGLPQKDPEPEPEPDPEPNPGPTPGTSGAGAGAQPKRAVAKKSTKPSPALKPLLRKRPSEDPALQVAKKKNPKFLSPGDVGYYTISQPFPRTAKRFSFGKKKRQGGKRWRPGTRALREVRHWQRDVLNLIP